MEIDDNYFFHLIDLNDAEGILNRFSFSNLKIQEYNFDK